MQMTDLNVPSSFQGDADVVHNPLPVRPHPDGRRSELLLRRRRGRRGKAERYAKAPFSPTIIQNYTFNIYLSSGVLHNMGAPPPPTRGRQVLNHLRRRDGDQTGENLRRITPFHAKT